MHFLPDVFIPCDTCKGARYNRETLEIRFKNKNIADILDMTVDEGCEFFENIQSIRSKLINVKTCWFRLYENWSTSYDLVRWRSTKNKIS